LNQFRLVGEGTVHVFAARQTSLLGVPPHRRLHIQRGEAGPNRMILMSERRAEEP
jgi:hypothetical protein